MIPCDDEPEPWEVAILIYLSRRKARNDGKNYKHNLSHDININFITQAKHVRSAQFIKKVRVEWE